MCFGKSKKSAPEPVVEEPKTVQVTRPSDVTPTGDVTYLTDGSEERESEVRKAEEELAALVAEEERQKKLSEERLDFVDEMKERRDKRNQEIIDATSSGGPYREITETETKDQPLVTADEEKPIGTTSVTYQTVVQQKPSDAAKKQEELSSAELARARQERARQKQSLLRKRLERSAEYGSGKKVLTGEERELRGMREDARVTEATGKRRGSGRRSLIAGSRGGIGFYSRYS
jgi:flagellar motility protein MotE (MotC chaperone)